MRLNWSDWLVAIALISQLGVEGGLQDAGSEEEEEWTPLKREQESRCRTLKRFKSILSPEVADPQPMD